MAASRRPSPLRPSIRLSPIHSRDNSRSASPERPERPRGSLYPEVDPLLSNLSPESTLAALTSTGTVPSNGSFSHDVLSKSISQVSPAERALGIRAAIAARNLDLWLKEVRSWKWYNNTDAQAGKGFSPPANSSKRDGSFESNSLSAPSNSVEFYGSLPAQVVEEYEKRIEEIRDGIDGLDVEELKEHVLNAHIPSRSRPSSSTSTVSVPPPLSYVQLSDFTAIVTATILRALPCLSRLSHLLNTWDVRLFVLRQVPGLLKELQTTRSILDASNRALQSSNTSENLDARLSSSFLRDEHVKIEGKVIDAGRRMDRTLDALEGRQDSLPEQWIDDLETIEADFAAWVVEAERYKLHTEWLHTKSQAQKAEPIQESQPEAQAPATEEREVEIDTKPAAPEPILPVAQIEPIEEESRSNSQLEVLTDSAPLEQPDSHDSTIFTDSDSLSQVSDPDTSYNPIEPEHTVIEEPKHDPESESNIIVAEDIQTPTQDEFPRDLHAQSPGVQSPSRIPLPMTPDVENKENIPPYGLLPQRSSSVRESPGAKPAALAEHIDDDPFIEKPLSPRPERNNEPEVVVAVAAPVHDKVQTASSFASEVKSESKKITHDATTIPSIDQSIAEPEQLSLTQQPLHSAHEPRESTPLKTPTLMSQPPETPDLDNHISDASARTPSSRAERPKPPAAEPQQTKAVLQSQSSNEYVPAKQNMAKKKPLQSPIKLSKVRSGNLSFDKSAPAPRARRQSSGSVGSFVSDDSNTSSPGVPEPHASSSNGDQMISQRPDYQKPVSRGGYMLREDRLRRFENSKRVTRSTEFQEARSVSLPLQRFINEKLDLDLTSPPVPEIPEQYKSMNHTARAKNPDISSTPTTQALRIPKRRPALAHGQPPSDPKKNEPVSNPPSKTLPAFGGNTARRAIQHQDQPKSMRLRHRLTAHPSLEGLGLRRQELAYVEEDASEYMDNGSGSSSPNKHFRKPRDHLDEKINSILSTLPGRIHLVDPNNEADTSSSSSSLDRKMRERCLSESPNGPPSRSMTPAPSLTLMPAARRRVSHAHKTEDSYVKLYHLHHGGSTAPTKLFVRTVGEDGQRVMVRVGGGWADLGEYLREYVIHHGRRKVSETPRVEVQGVASRSPSGHSPGSLLPPSASYIASGRATPSRPSSVLSVRPPSSLTVRKTRRDSTASEAVPPRSVTAGNLSFFTSPPSAGLPGQRRLSFSSSYSFGGDILSPPTTHASTHENSAPLGLAGPKPRSRQISMSPEGEAWVENVLQKTRRSTSFNPPPLGLSTSPKNNDVGSPRLPEEDTTGRSIPKVRSVNDIRAAGSSRRVSLRGLGNHR
ncbi:hypothetical protein N7478_011048 [Penicillium angulare]|uniref:uncharacterized protein n=1 Tax=Penicillium angulare TaxID=116970 RepID=UPI0025408253|nr:uncharacterized protein N7478_011048 [Penicillium angulare]KAJ5263443.1 hypothetical protein N7478_011048 [Penicillium angulare]